MWWDQNSYRVQQAPHKTWIVTQWNWIDSSDRLSRSIVSDNHDSGLHGTHEISIGMMFDLIGPTRGGLRWMDTHVRTHTGSQTESFLSRR